MQLGPGWAEHFDITLTNVRLVTAQGLDGVIFRFKYDKSIS